MGISHFGRSASKYPDDDQCTSPAGVSRSKYDDDTLGFQETIPNPDPNNYKIIRSETCIPKSKKGKKKRRIYLVVEINYPDCTNYEGNKVLIYEGIMLRDLLMQQLIDPHFSDNKKYKSPIARFEPTQRGWNMAKLFAESLMETRKV
jgi:hypothetical protein